MTAHDNKHFTLDQRQLIEKRLNNCSSFKQIALTISKDCSMVSKEVRRNRVFYCDPMQPGQKGTLENKHIELRYILPKETDLRALGLTDQNALNLVISHVNSSSCEILGGRSPLELIEFMYHDLYDKLTAFGIQKIKKDKVILKPYLLKK